MASSLLYPQQNAPLGAAGGGGESSASGQAGPSFDPEASPIPGQQAWAILDLHGKLVRSSADGSSSNNSGGDTQPPILADAPTLYNMLVESTPLVASGLNRMTINFSSLRYVVARDEHHVYLVQTKGV